MSKKSSMYQKKQMQWIQSHEHNFLNICYDSKVLKPKDHDINGSAQTRTVIRIYIKIVRNILSQNKIQSLQQT